MSLECVRIVLWNERTVVTLERPSDVLFGGNLHCARTGLLCD